MLILPRKAAVLVLHALVQGRRSAAFALGRFRLFARLALVAGCGCGSHDDQSSQKFHRLKLADVGTLTRSRAPNIEEV